MIIRTAIVADAPQIAELWNPLIDATSITFTSEKKTIDGLEAVIRARGDAFKVIEEGGTLQGFATFFQFRAGPGYARTMEHSIILASQAQGRGQGKKLMAALEAEARQSGVHSLWAGVSGQNPAGVAFHRKIGFDVIARLPQVGYKFDRWIDLVLMQKIL